MKLLVLDLDETILYATKTKLEREEDFVCSEYFVYTRPGLEDFLRFAFDRFKVGVWTSSSKSYADHVVSEIFGTRFALEFMWSRERCTRRYDHEMHEEYYVKNLAKLKKKGYELASIIMIDNTPKKLESNYGNLVQIRDFTGADNDLALEKLTRFLTYLQDVENIRSVEKRGWHLKQWS